VCFVENPVSEDHYVVRDRPQNNLAALRWIGAGTQSGTEVPFDHAVHGLYLPALPIGQLVKPLMHKSPVTTAGWFPRRTADLVGNNGPDAQVLAGEAVRLLTVIARVRQQRRDGHRADPLLQGPAVVGAVGGRSPFGDGSQDQVTRSRFITGSEMLKRCYFQGFSVYRRTENRL
jgi:hypothetical protein